MIPKRIQEATHLLGAPKGWNKEKHGPCARLAVRLNDGVYESAWEPTPHELAALNAGGSVILRIAGSQPPVMLYVSSEASEDVE